MNALTIYLDFWRRMIQTAFTGSLKYFLWLGSLLVIATLGFFAHLYQLHDGLVVTNLTNQVSWGIYVANFTYLVGVLAVSVLLVVPSFLLKDESFKEVVLLGQLLAFCVIVMALLFITVDLGRPERFSHILPIIGKMNFPDSILAWDVIVLTGYLLINAFIPAYILFKLYRKESPHGALYYPFIFLSVAWALSIHTVSAFLYAGLGGRPFWNSAVLAPRFFVSAFACGPAILILILKAVAHFTNLKPHTSVFRKLRIVMTYTLFANLFLFGCEIFKEFYTGSAEVISMQYLLFGLHGKGIIRPYIWAAIIMEVTAFLFLVLPQTRLRLNFRLAACVFIIFGIWIEKGMGLIVPGFIPTPLGDLVEYDPSLTELTITAGIYAFGAIIYTVCAKVCVAIQTGEMSLAKMKKQIPA